MSEKAVLRHLRINFEWQLGLRAALLFLALLWTSMVFANTDLFITPTAMLLGCIGLTLEFIAFIRRSNQSVARFLSQIEFDDFAQRMPVVSAGAGFDDLAVAMNRIIERLWSQRLLQEQDRRTLQSIIENVPSPLFSVHDDGSISIHNHAARRFFATESNLTSAELAHWGPELWRAIEDQSPQQSRVVRVQLGDDAPKRMALSLAQIVVGGQRQRLISLQNISSDLDASELEAWEQMARVLAHEIMNSLTPVASLSVTARDLLNSDEDDAQEQAAVAIDTVARRADSLMEFVQAYRRFARLPTPTPSTIALRPLLERMVQLAEADARSNPIEWSVHVQPSALTVQADAEQLEQVLINLVSNAVQAVQDQVQAAIQLSARINRDSRTTIEVSDNGPGLDD
ncbi:MAG: ATP-binding protein, partial [Pseudomonadota bacterium]